MSQTDNNKYTVQTGNGDYSDCVQLASEVFDLVARYMTPPRPRTYELWYSYAARQNDAMRKDIETVLEKSGTLSDYDVEQILLEHNDEDKGLAEKQDAISRDFDHELSNVMDMMQSSAERSQDYTEKLGEASQGLNALDDPEKIRDVVQKLIMKNREMQLQSEALTDNLQRSQAHIQSLREDLADLRAKSLKDPLTQLGNRGFFDATLAREIAAAKATGNSLCLAMTDIDHFKGVNDRHGHLIGDWILKDFAALISASIKGRDSAARYGGEEFAIILPLTSLTGARSLIETIRRQFEAKERILKQSGKPMEAVTASFGIASLREDDDIMDLIQRADENLYTAKNSGRNRTVIDAE